MFKTNYHKATAAPLLLLGMLTLNACATKKVWSPELEDARDTYQQISADKIVASLAATELQEAEIQLQKAQAASDQYRTQEVVRHEAQLAKIRVLVAQQRARALSANHKLQLTLGQQPLLSEAVVLAALPTPQAEPVMAAALPADAATDNVAAQLAALTAQVAALQAQLQNRADQPAVNQTAMTPAPAAMGATSMAAPAAEPEAPNMDAPIKLKPQIAAALPESAASRLLPSPDRLHQELRAINAKAGSRGMSLTLGERYFAQGTARLWSGRAARHLDNVAAILSENPSLQLDIEAHTDNQSSEQSNFDLSVDRAVSIKSALVLRGIKSNRINATGYGDSRPVADNASPLGRLQNRRVELVFPNVPAPVQ